MPHCSNIHFLVQKLKKTWIVVLIFLKPIWQKILNQKILNFEMLRKHRYKNDLLPASTESLALKSMNISSTMDFSSSLILGKNWNVEMQETTLEGKITVYELTLAKPFSIFPSTYSSTVDLTTLFSAGQAPSSLFTITIMLM